MMHSKKFILVVTFRHQRLLKHLTDISLVFFYKSHSCISMQAPQNKYEKGSERNLFKTRVFAAQVISQIKSLILPFRTV